MGKMPDELWFPAGVGRSQDKTDAGAKLIAARQGLRTDLRFNEIRTACPAQTALQQGVVPDGTMAAMVCFGPLTLFGAYLS